jgi:hypothetical protein
MALMGVNDPFLKLGKFKLNQDMYGWIIKHYNLNTQTCIVLFGGKAQL